MNKYAKVRVFSEKTPILAFFTQWNSVRTSVPRYLNTCQYSVAIVVVVGKKVKKLARNYLIKPQKRIESPVKYLR